MRAPTASVHRVRPRASAAAVALAVALTLAACAPRGSHQEGWVSVSDQVRYRSTPMSGNAVRLEVAYLRSAISDDDAARTAARDAFRQVAIDLGDPAFDAGSLALSDQTTPNGVREITVSGVAAP